MSHKALVLLVEDEKGIRNFISTVLDVNNYRVVEARDGKEALELFTSRCPDLILLDLGLPDMDGIEVLKTIRGWSGIPIIVVSARGHEREKVEALDLGADDYITKPFLAQELLLRLHAVLRRVYRAASEEESARLGGTEVHWGTGTLRRDGREVPLTAKEFALLKKLWENHGNIVTIDALCQALWEGPMVGYENTLMVHIRRLREKLEADPSHPKHLLTVRGLGYRLVREAAP